MEKPDVKFTSDLDTGETEVEKTDTSAEAKEEPKEEKVSEEKVETVPKEHYENLKKALQETRGKSRAALDSLSRRLEATEKKLAEIKEKKEEIDIFEGANDEDALTVAGAKKLAEQTRAALQEREQRYNEMMGTMLVGVSEILFEKDHPDYKEVTAPFKDLLGNDSDFMKRILSDGIERAPQKLYEYAKKQMVEEEETKSTQIKEPAPIDKPKTMDKKSKSESTRLDPGRLTIDEKRKLKPEDIDNMWLNLVK